MKRTKQDEKRRKKKRKYGKTMRNDLSTFRDTKANDVPIEM